MHHSFINFYIFLQCVRRKYHFTSPNIHMAINLNNPVILLSDNWIITTNTDTTKIEITDLKLTCSHRCVYIIYILYTSGNNCRLDYSYI